MYDYAVFKLFVAMPSKRTPDGEFRDIAHPINSDMRTKIQQSVLIAYENAEETNEEESIVEQV